MADPIIWPLFPNWDGGVLERLEWLTSILSSPSGAEQRRQLRINPRRTIEAGFVLDGTDRMWADLALQDRSVEDWYFPIWHDVTFYQGGLALNATEIPIDTTGLDYTVGGLVAVRGRGQREVQTYTITDIQPNKLVVDRVARSWNEPVFIYPVRRGRFSEQPKLTRLTDRNWTVQAEIIFSENSPWPETSFSLMHLGLPVFDTRPNEDETIDSTYQRLTVEADNQTGIPKVTDTANLGFATQTFYWTLRGRQANAELRSLLYYLRGRLRPVWIPSHYEDLQTTTPVLSGGHYMTVKNVGYTAFAGRRPGKEDIYILMKNGMSYCRRVKSSYEADPSREVLVLEEALPPGWDWRQVLRISFLSLMRLNQDSIEIDHQADTMGVSRVTAIFRAAPDLRVATDWSPVPFPSAFMSDTDCGCTTGCCGSPWAQNGGTPTNAWLDRYQDYIRDDLTPIFVNNIIGKMGQDGATPEQIQAREEALAAIASEVAAYGDKSEILFYLATLLVSLGLPSAYYGIEAYVNSTTLTITQLRKLAQNINLQMQMFTEWNYRPVGVDLLEGLRRFQASIKKSDEPTILGEFCIEMSTTSLYGTRRGATTQFWPTVANIFKAYGLMDSWVIPPLDDFTATLDGLDGLDLTARPGRAVVPVMISEFFAAHDYDSSANLPIPGGGIFARAVVTRPNQIPADSRFKYRQGSTTYGVTDSITFLGDRSGDAILQGLPNGYGAYTHYALLYLVDGSGNPLPRSLQPTAWVSDGGTEGDYKVGYDQMLTYEQILAGNVSFPGGIPPGACLGIWNAYEGEYDEEGLPTKRLLRARPIGSIVPNLYSSFRYRAASIEVQMSHSPDQSFQDGSAYITTHPTCVQSSTSVGSFEGRQWSWASLAVNYMAGQPSTINTYTVTAKDYRKKPEELHEDLMEVLPPVGSVLIIQPGFFNTDTGVPGPDEIAVRSPIDETIQPPYKQIRDQWSPRSQQIYDWDQEEEKYAAFPASDPNDTSEDPFYTINGTVVSLSDKCPIPTYSLAYPPRVALNVRVEAPSED